MGFVCGDGMNRALLPELTERCLPQLTHRYLSLQMIEVRETTTFSEWLSGLRDARGKADVARRVRRLALGNPGDVKPVGEGVSELRIHYGPGIPGLLRAAREAPDRLALRRRQERSG
jgi:hypothetical protein